MIRIFTMFSVLVSCALAESAPIDTASPEHHALFERIRPLILENGAKPVPPLSKSGESWFWTNSHRMTPLLDAYEYTHDIAFLDTFVSLMEGVLAERYVHPTDPETWSGWYHYQVKSHSYMVIHAGIVYYKPALRFVEQVRADPALTARYGEIADNWYTDITEISISGWDRRGAWKEIGNQEGWYVKHTQKPDASTHSLIPEADKLAGTSYAYNKLHEMLRGFLIAYRLSGDPWYRDRIEQCARVFRRNWRIDDSHAEWNYREILGPWDYKSGILGEGETYFTSWVHPKGGYYGTDVGYVVECYNHGILFSRADIEKLIQTNTEFMYRGDKASPRFANIDGSFKVYEEKSRKSFGHGSLWSSLAQFSPRIRELWKQQIDRADPARYGYANSVMAYLLATSSPITWTPRYSR